ncbi:MAG TPA: MarR family transcriptional regulator [Spirochaetia bacterium]|nr:MarR family transcriptional regulator [Spirochaetia bacterium]
MRKTNGLSETEYIQINQAIFSLQNAYESRMRRERDSQGDDLTIADMGVIMVLGQFGRITAKTLATLMDITPGTVSQYVSRLQVRGLINQERNDHDRRSWWLTLSDAGSAAYRSAFDGAVQYTRDMLRMLDSGQQRLLHDLLLTVSHGNGYEWQ